MDDVLVSCGMKSHKVAEEQGYVKAPYSGGLGPGERSWTGDDKSLFFKASSASVVGMTSKEAVPRV